MGQHRTYSIVIEPAGDRTRVHVETWMGAGEYATCDKGHLDQELVPIVLAGAERLTLSVQEALYGPFGE